MQGLLDKQGEVSIASSQEYLLVSRELILEVSLFLKGLATLQ